MQVDVGFGHYVLRQQFPSMSYLVRPRSPLHTPIEVGCEAKEDYDGLPLDSYPQRKGFGSRASVEWTKLFASPTEEFKAFLHTWLFFGLLTQTMLPSPPRSAMSLEGLTTILESPRRITIDTVKLGSLVEEWLRLKKSSTRKPSDEGQITRNLVFVVTIVNCLERHDQDSHSVQGDSHSVSLHDYLMSNPVKNPLSPEITLSINLLIDVIYGGSQLDASNSKFTHRNVFTYKHNRLARWASPITLRMRRDGWCHYNISMLHERLNSAGLCFASDLERPSTDLVHPTIRVSKALDPKAPLVPSKQTDLCTHYRCAQTMLKPEEYKTKHVDGCNGCVDMVADRDEIHSILLEKGSFPLILTIDEDDERVTLCEYDDDLSYVAISHVWSDGLGNLERNALPKCQMLRLSKYVRSLDGDKTKGILLFWIDTLCVPPDPVIQDEEVLNAQEVAISFMRKTYEDAQAVLVLDSWLLSHSIRQDSPTETLMRIVSSNWNTRLWTLQEGALAKNLLFQFADVAFDSELGIEDMLSDRNKVTSVTLHTPIVQCFEDIRSLAWNDMSRPNLISLMHALKVRSTSVAADEALCLAALMRVSLEDVIKAPAGDRMKTFWSLLEEVPQTMIFYTGIKLQVPGFRWAPRTFLRPQSRSQDISRNLPIRNQAFSLGKVTLNGLQVEYPGLDIYLADSTPLQAGVYFCNEAGEYFQGMLPQQNTPEAISGLFHDDHTQFVTPMAGTDLLIMNIAGLLDAHRVPIRLHRMCAVRVLHVILQYDGAMAVPQTSGLLAVPSTRHGEGDTVNVHGVCRINIGRLGTAQQCAEMIAKAMNIPVSQLRRVEEGFMMANGMNLFPIARCKLRTSQVWCVD